MATSNRTKRIFRVSKDTKELEGYSMISHSISPKHLTMEEMGLMLYLLSKTDDWKVIPKAIAKEFSLSNKTAYKRVTGLVNKGYIKKYNLAGGIEYEIHEKPRLVS